MRIKMIGTVILLAVLGGGAGYMIKLSGHDTGRPDPPWASDAASSIPTDWNDYMWPTDASVIRSSDFCEFRPTHFHAGLDIATGGRTGFKTFATRDGWLHSISFEPYGYGWILVLRHKDGFHSCYAHLGGFPDSIRSAYRAQLAAAGRSYGYAEWKDGAYPVRKGQVVAFTGESGAGPAHLHFELRDPDYNPVNPQISRKLRIADSIPPEPMQLRFEPLDALSSVDGSFEGVSYKLQRKSDGNWSIPRTPVLRGRVGMLLRAHDRAQAGQDYPTPYDIMMQVDGKSYFRVRFDRIQRDDGWFIRIDRDHWLMKHAQGEFRKLYREEGNALSVYQPEQADAGVLSTKALGRGPHQVALRVSDESGNHVPVTCAVQLMDATEPIPAGTVRGATGKSEHDMRSVRGTNWVRDISFDEIVYTIRGASATPTVTVQQGSTSKDAAVLPLGGGLYRAVLKAWQGFDGEATATIRMKIGGAENTVTDRFCATLISVAEGGTIRSADGRCEIRFAAGDVYRSMLCGVTALAGSEGMYKAWPEDVPLAGSPIVSMQESGGPGKPLIAATAPGTNLKCRMRPSTSQGRIEGSFVRLLGTYRIVRDEAAPVIGISKGGRAGAAVFVTLTDTVSGVDPASIVATLDGHLLPMEFSEGHRCWFIPSDAFRATKGGTLTVKVSDVAGNSASKELRVR